MPSISGDTRIALVGCGKMGEAILKGWVASDVTPASELSAGSFTVVDPAEQHAADLNATYGVKVVADVAALEGEGPFDIVVLAVKPQVMGGVLSDLASSPVMDANPLVVTIAAGVPTSTYEDALPGGVHVVRVMPNMPLQVGMGASVVTSGAFATPEEVQLVNGLFSALGVSFVVPEEQIDAVCAISGGGPAYVAYMVEALRDAGINLGLDARLAETLALETVGGTYQAMVESGQSPEDMRISVCSPGGTTLAALGAMDDAGFKPMYDDAMKAAVKRAEELRELA